MKILFLPSWYPTDRDPNAGNFIQDLARDLSKEGIVIEVFFPNLHYKNKTKHSVSKTRSNGFQECIVSQWFPPKRFPFIQRLWVDKVVNIAERLLDISSFDLIHSHDMIGAFIGAKLSKQYNVKHIISFHYSGFLLNNIPNWRIQTLKKSIKDDDTLIVPSRSLKDAIHKIAPNNKIQIIPNYHTIKYEPKELRIGEKIKCLSVGGFGKVKRPIFLINEFSKLSNNYCLDIVGDGELLEDAKKLISDKALTDRVRIISPMSKAALVEIYEDYDLFISSSSYETFGMSMLEAIASGIPVVTTAKGGANSFINGSNGCVVDDKAFVTSIEKIVKNLKDSKASEISDSVANYHRIKIIPNYIALYHQLK